MPLWNERGFFKVLLLLLHLISEASSWLTWTIYKPVLPLLSAGDTVDVCSLRGCCGAAKIIPVCLKVRKQALISLNCDYNSMILYVFVTVSLSVGVWTDFSVSGSFFECTSLLLWSSERWFPQWKNKNNKPAWFCRFSWVNGSVWGCFLSLFKRENCTVLLKI